MKLAVLEIAYICFFHKILQDFFDKTVKNHSSMLILSIFDNFWKIRIFSQTLSPLGVPGLRCSILGSTYMINFLNFFLCWAFCRGRTKMSQTPFLWVTHLVFSFKIGHENLFFYVNSENENSFRWQMVENSYDQKKVIKTQFCHRCTVYCIVFPFLE